MAEPSPGHSGEGGDVEVLVVAYGSPDDLGDCLKRLQGTVPVTVVDNSSLHEIRALADGAGARYLDPGENLGFAAGVNLGLSTLDLSSCDVLLLNPDASIAPSELAALRRRLHEAEDIACVAPAQHRPGSEVPAQVRWPFATPGRAWAEAVGLGRLGGAGDPAAGFLIASVLLVRGKALLDVGGFDEGFFLYAEEADWEHRAVGRGWRLVYCPEASAEHLGAATDHDSTRHQLRFHAGVERYVRKWHGPAGWRSYQAATVITALRRALLSPRGRGRSSLELAGLYAGGPYRRARRAQVVPQRRHHVPAWPSPSAGPVGTAPRGEVPE